MVLVRVLHMVTCKVFICLNKLARLKEVFSRLQDLINLFKLSLDFFLSVRYHSLLRLECIVLLQVDSPDDVDRGSEKQESRDVHEQHFLQFFCVPDIHGFAIYFYAEPLVQKLVPFLFDWHFSLNPTLLVNVALDIRPVSELLLRSMKCRMHIGSLLLEILFF